MTATLAWRTPALYPAAGHRVNAGSAPGVWECGRVGVWAGGTRSWEGEAPAEPLRRTRQRLGRSLALPRGGVQASATRSYSRASVTVTSTKVPGSAAVPRT